MHPRAYWTRTICSPLRPLRTQRGSLREPTSRCRLPHLSRPADPCPWSADVVCRRQARPCSRSGPIEGMLCRPLFYYNSNTNNAFPSPSPPPTTSGSTLPCDRWNSASPYSAVQPRVYMTNNNDSHKLKFLSCNSTTKNRPSYRLLQLFCWKSRHPFVYLSAFYYVIHQTIWHVFVIFWSIYLFSITYFIYLRLGPTLKQ